MIAIRAATGMEVMLERTVAYAKERQAFGQPVIDFQHNRFKLAEAKAHYATLKKRSKKNKMFVLGGG